MFILENQSVVRQPMHLTPIQEELRVIAAAIAADARGFGLRAFHSRLPRDLVLFLEAPLPFQVPAGDDRFNKVKKDRRYACDAPLRARVFAKIKAVGLCAMDHASDITSQQEALMEEILRLDCQQKL